VPDQDQELLVKLADFDRYGLTAQERVLLRMEAWRTIRRLRAENADLRLQLPKNAIVSPRCVDDAKEWDFAVDGYAQREAARRPASE